MLYFAYGSNLWLQQMTVRCPGNRKIGVGLLNGWRWIITTRGYASIIVSDSDYVLGTVYELGQEDEQSLDCFEGVAQGSYRKEMMPVEVDGRALNCLVYIDPEVRDGEPKEEYITRINKGIRDARLPEDYVNRYLRPYIPVGTDA